MSKKEFLCDYYNLVKTDIIGVVDETFRYYIVNYLDYIPLGAFDSKKVSASALTNIYLFNSLNYGKQKK